MPGDLDNVRGDLASGLNVHTFCPVIFTSYLNFTDIILSPKFKIGGAMKCTKKFIPETFSLFQEHGKRFFDKKNCKIYDSFVITFDIHSDAEPGTKFDRRGELAGGLGGGEEQLRKILISRIFV